MSDRSALLSLPYILPAQAQKHVTHNEALRQLDLLVQLTVLDRTRSAPPDSPADGDRHIVAAGASGAWAGQEDAIALYAGSEGWQFTAPQSGWQALVLAETAVAFWDGANWDVLEPDLNQLDGIGIGTDADATNRLSVASPATLLSHEGAGHQLKINKSASAETASLLFQTGWSGRAEMGTAGADDFAVKVSADGANWLTGLSLEAGTGIAQAPQGLSAPALTGLAVQQSPDDITAGRVMRADWGYGPGTVLGVVSQLGGLPSGALIEQGSNANGNYTRFADGTQICTGNVTLVYQNSSTLQFDWVYPAGFDGGFQTAMASVNAGASSGNITPSLSDLGAVAWSNSGSNGSIGRMSLRRVTGTTNFQSGDQASIKAVAFGRWF